MPIDDVKICTYVDRHVCNDCQRHSASLNYGLETRLKRQWQNMVFKMPTILTFLTPQQISPLLINFAHKSA